MIEAIIRADGAIYTLKPHERELTAAIERDQPRVKHEWAKVWDGTPEHGVALNDAQCARIDALMAKHGMWSQEYTDFISREYCLHSK